MSDFFLLLVDHGVVDHSMEHGMRVEILGPLSVRLPDGVVTVPAAKQRILLAALALHAGEIVSVDELIEAVWDGAPPSAARVAMRNYVKRIRTVLGAAVGSRIITRAPGYLIELAEDELDVSLFRALYRRGSTAIEAHAWQDARSALHEGLALWRGTPLADVPSRALRDAEVQRLEQMRLQAIEWRIEADLRLGRANELIPELRELIEKEPFRERLHCQLMLALHRSNRQAEALAAYRHVREILVGELGVEPGPELQQLHQRILAGEAQPIGQSAAGPVESRRFVRPRQLPATVRHFVGRSAELATLDDHYEQSKNSTAAVVISAIGGTAGIGKTALALYWAHRVAEHFPDGQLYVNLHGFDPCGEPMSAAEAIRGFLDALQVAPERIPTQLDRQAGLYRTVLADRRMLIVLDNAHDTDQVRPLLPGGGNSMVLVTSRSRLEGLVAAEGAQLLALDVLSDNESRELLARRLSAERIAAEPEAVAELITLCAGLPLALSVATAKIAARPGFSLTSLASELRDAHDRLKVLDGGDSATSVRAVFSWSYRQLGARTARIFRLLGLHPGPDVTPRALASMTAISVAEAAETLDELTGLHLLSEHPPGRYSFHDLLRAYASELADAHDDQADRNAALLRLLDHFLHSGHIAAMLLRPTQDPLVLPRPAPGVLPERFSDQQDALAWYEAEHTVLLALVQQAVDSGFDTHAWQLPWILADYFEMRAHWVDWARTQSIALSAASRTGDRVGQAHAHRNLGRACVRRGEADSAHAFLRRSLELYRQLGDSIGQAQAHNTLATVMEQEGRYEEALEHARRTLRIYQELGHEAGQARALNGVGWGYALLGDHEQALDHCEQALELIRKLGDRYGEAATLDSLGYVQHSRGDHQQAISSYRQALSLYEELGQTYGQADTLIRLAETHHASGDINGAREAWQQAWEILNDLDHPDADQVLANIRRIDEPT